jgi:hypothetical protein
MIPTIRSAFCAVAGAAVAFAALAVQPSTSEAAQAKLVAGTLTCKGHGGVGLILGSKETLHCIFTSPSGVHRRPYVATITKVGVDIGFKGESTLIWTVLSSTSDIPSGALVGTYGGVTAGAAVGVGGNANALVGGSNDSIALQPVSVAGQTGLNIAVGVAGLTLRRG